MHGLDLNKEIQYLFSSLRFFDPKEYHVDRFCKDDILLLVYEGVLRFREDGVLYEIHPGEYHIQKHDSRQEGALPSDSPKYLYVHFHTQWTEDSILPKNGTFDYLSLKRSMEELNSLCHNNAPYIIQKAKFLEILASLCKPTVVNTTAAQISSYLQENCQQNITISMLCKEFSFSKNHIINLFKKEFGQTPITYLNSIRLNKAEELLITTSELIETISLRCGYRNYSHFYRQFVRKNKVSPETFRLRRRMGEFRQDF